ncbi:hypothetical protein FMUND_5342 [Fusarium mundagurra]|uniref:Uncharacterized protein n=1 Tax=Fusarium mundagurra TaxID=1567541 RepID=A0A8H5YV98_9HYPO|nr:hypothetical protein FMUND_5342 [Fusarium mundagurra]
MDPDWKEVKQRSMRSRLQSLRLRLMDLAKNLDNFTTEQLVIHCGAIMEDIRSFSYDCIAESRDRLDEFQFYWRVGEIEVLIKFCVNEELGKFAWAENRQPRMTREKRREMLTDLKFDIPFTEMCFVPFDAYDFFMSLGQAFKDLVVDELRHRAQDDVMSDLQSIKEEPGIKEEQSIKEDRSIKEEEGVSRPRRFEIHLPGEFIPNDVLKQKFRDLAVNFDDSSNRWAKQQIDAYQRYLQLPVTEKVAAAAVEEYDDCLRDDHEFGGEAFRKEVPEVEPRLEQLDIDFDKVVTSQYGIVVAWKYVGGDKWYDRYGHVVPELVADQSIIHHGRRWSDARKEEDCVLSD